MANRGEQLHEDTITRLNVILAEIDVASIALQQMAQAAIPTPPNRYCIIPAN